jgi:simple sugar transport system permease protein
MEEQQSCIKQIFGFLANNIIPVIFVFLVLLGFLIAKEIKFSDYIAQLFEIVFRNSVLLLALIIPVIAGLGMNFGIVIGAIAAQLAILFVRWYDIPGIWGFLICVVVSLPLALLFGWLLGKLYNKTRGIETITGLIASHLASGLYLFIMLYAVGGIIPVAAKGAVLTPLQQNILAPSGVGVRVSVELGSLKYSLDGIWRIPFVHFVIIASTCGMAYLIIQYLRKKNNPALGESNFGLTVSGFAACLIFIALSVWAMITKNVTYMNLRPAPMVTIIVIMLLAIATNFLLKTKLGRNFHSVGQSQQQARDTGINVDRTRIIATVISTILAAWGMLIYMQNIGTMATYTQHTSVGMFSVAAIIVGGATVSRASVKNAFLGLILFYSVFIFSPAMGLALFGNPLFGENFRSFMMYGAITAVFILWGIQAAKHKKEEE